MCGRTAQSVQAVEAAAQFLSADRPERRPSTRSNSRGGAASASSQPTAEASGDVSSTAAAEQQPQQADGEMENNYNLSPGMEAYIFWKDPDSDQIRCTRKVWGLVTKHGTHQHPLPTGMSAHFTNLMFNARADTLYSKPTFARLANKGQTCLVALDGFFEWKAATSKASPKQPYFVYRKTTPDQQQERPFLLLQGLWTSVPTGRADTARLDTFTLCTTDACPALQWLHSRMPVTVWDERLALAWLQAPSPSVHQQLEEQAAAADENMLAWHAVARAMSSLKYRSKDAIQALPPQRSIASFFSAPATSTTASGSAKKKKRAVSETKKKKETPKRFLSSAAPPSSQKKKAKKGTLASFFAPTQKKS